MTNFTLRGILNQKSILLLKSKMDVYMAFRIVSSASKVLMTLETMV